ncbi:MAG: hypothetical protein R3E67_06505 [Pseudomonadales bacterium]
MLLVLNARRHDNKHEREALLAARTGSEPHCRGFCIAMQLGIKMSWYLMVFVLSRQTESCRARGVV